MSEQWSITDMIEEAVAATVEAHREALQSVRQMYGPRPYGYAKGDRFDRLQFFLDHCDDALWWEAYIAKATAEAGGNRIVGEYKAAQYCTAMRRMLAAAGGREAVLRVLEERRIARALPAIRKAERLLARPKLTIVPANPPHDEYDLWFMERPREVSA